MPTATRPRSEAGEGILYYEECGECEYIFVYLKYSIFFPTTIPIHSPALIRQMFVHSFFSTLTSEVHQYFQYLLMPLFYVENLSFKKTLNINIRNSISKKKLTYSLISFTF
jgi:hypothetical protein